MNTQEKNEALVQAVEEIAKKEAGWSRFPDLCHTTIVCCGRSAVAAGS